MSLPKLPGYELHERLGGGPFTMVYAARDLATGRRVALKLPRDVEFADVLIRREAEAGLRVRHPHLVCVRRAHFQRLPQFIVLDWIDGESLRTILEREGRLDVRRSLWIVRQVADALSAVHRLGFVHGDVKPENVLLTRNGSAVLIDLGFARRPGENAPFRKRGIVLGTANYLAPEMGNLEIDGDSSVDLFSLGVMAFETLTGRLPYPTGNVRETLAAHRGQKPLDLREIPGHWPTSLRRLLSAMLSRRPSARPCASVVMLELMRLEIHALSA